MKTARLLCMVALVFMIFTAPLSVAVAWDRYSNDTELLRSSGVSFRPIVHYSFYVGYPQWVTLETTNSSGDTYMYLWSDAENRQITKDDDGGVGYHSKIVTYLQPGYYRVFIRSYSSDALSTCDLYYNGSRVLSGVRFAGTHVWVSGLYAETRFRTDNIIPTSGSSDTYMLLLNGAGDLIGYNDDWGGLASMIEAAEAPSRLIVGAYNYWSDYGGTCDVKFTQDLNIEYLSLCGNESRHISGGNTFKNYFNSGSYYYDSVLQSKSWEFIGDSRMSYADGVDLVFLYSHGPGDGFGGRFLDYDGVWADFTAPGGSAGSGHRTSNRSGDLEYLAILSCQTVRIVSETTWDWLRDVGWQSYYNASGVLQKGFFDGAHMVVGTHDTHNVYSRWWSDWAASYTYEAQRFADYLDAGYSVWEAWKCAKRDATDQMHHWLYQSHVNLGDIAQIYVGPSQDERIFDHQSPDYKIGDSNYWFGWRKNWYYYN